MLVAMFASFLILVALKDEFGIWSSSSYFDFIFYIMVVVHGNNSTLVYSDPDLNIKEVKKVFSKS